ncbi:hypothetical protein V5799_002694, partial [Amblyomma americanum]
MTQGGSKSAQKPRPPTAGSLNYAQDDSALLSPESAPQVPRERTDAKTDAASSSADQERQLGEHEKLERDKAETRELLDEGRHQGVHEEAQGQLDGVTDNKCMISPDESNVMQPNYRPEIEVATRHSGAASQQRLCKEDNASYGNLKSPSSSIGNRAEMPALGKSLTPQRLLGHYSPRGS